MLNGMNKYAELYANSPDLATWGGENVPDENLSYGAGMKQQLHNYTGVYATLPNWSTLPPRVVGSHTSKSVKLPVVCFRFGPYREAYAFSRDNFHDIKIVVISDAPIYMPYHTVHEEWSVERYHKEIERCRNYNENEPERLAEMADGTDDWYKKWSSGSIIRKDGRIYRAGSSHRVYCEGINELGLPDSVFKPYEDGSQEFVCETRSYPTVALILEHIIRSLAREQHEETKNKNLWDYVKKEDAYRI